VRNLLPVVTFLRSTTGLVVLLISLALLFSSNEPTHSIGFVATWCGLAIVIPGGWARRVALGLVITFFAAAIARSIVS
jgi:hypothetical protein